MADLASFTTPSGAPAGAAIQAELTALTTITVGDLLFLGQFARSRILERTAKGVDVNGAPFTPYSTKGPYYLYPNAGSAGNVRGPLAPSDAGTLAEVRHARSTAAKNRLAKTGSPGKRTPYGIRYPSYAAAKEAHGVSGVNLIGMEQHTHMLNTMMVRAGGAEAPAVESGAFAGLDFRGEFDAFEQTTPCRQLTIGFYGPEAERAKGNNEGTGKLPKREFLKGNNEGTGKLPKREFFALSPEDLQLGGAAVGERMFQRARAKR